MIWFISDSHFGHEKIIHVCDRKFSDSEEMDNIMIYNWNSVVKPDDTVYIVGDLMYEGIADPSVYLNRLNGKKILIIGNHDGGWMTRVDASQYFEMVVPYYEMKYEETKITLSHFPFLEWPSSRLDSSEKYGYLIHGHIHNYAPDEYMNVIRNPFQLNAGVEVNDYMPVSLEQLIKNNETYKLENISNMVERAKFLARKYYFQQKSEDGRPYISYLKELVMQVDSDEEKVIAYLRDIQQKTTIDSTVIKNCFPNWIIEKLSNEI